MRLRFVLPLLVLIAGCGGGGGTATTTVTKAAPAPPAPTAQGDVAVIRSWADDLRNGDVDGATKLWNVPATVANGTPPVVLNSAALVRAFNATLPCGAKLISTKRDGQTTIATFVLTERRGGGGACGKGVGQRASTRFLIRHGRIVEWARVAVPEDQQNISPPV